MSISEGEPGGMVVFVSGVRGDTRRYRTVHPCEQLCELGIPAVVSHITDPRLPALLRRAAIAVFHRVACDRYIETLIRGLRRQGGLALFDADDLTFDPQAFQWIDSPDFVDPVRARLYQEEMRRNQATLSLCDGALASTGYLSRRIQALGKAARVHRNGFTREMQQRSEQAVRNRTAHTERVVVGYASGTPTHNRDFAIVKPALQRLLRRFPQVELSLVGPLDPGEGWEGSAGRIHHHPLVPWRELPELLAGFDINLAPLVSDNPFAQSKSEIKFVEAALVQVPTIASPIEAFAETICSGRNGWLAASTEDWEQGLTRWIENPDERLRIVNQAQRDVMAGYRPYARGEQLLETLNAFSADLDGPPLSLGMGEPGSRAEGILTDPSLAKLALYTLRHRGLGTLLQQEWIYVRRLAAPIFPFDKNDVKQDREDPQ